MQTNSEELVQAFIDPVTKIPFVKLQGVSTQTATDVSDFIKNMRLNLKKNYKTIRAVPGFQVIKGHDKPIALLGGGPSIKKEIEQIKTFQAKGYETIACGSSHDWLIENEIIPTYCAVCDPDPISIEYLKKKHKDVIYLIAFSCDEKILEYLSDQTVYLWHCHSDEAYNLIKDEINEYDGISGGCTVGLRAISIAMMFGYTNIHFWGFDSCQGENDAHHAYEFATEAEAWQTKEIYKIKMGGNSPDPKTYYCLGYQLAQAYHFQMFYDAHNSMFTPTFHGEGMLADFMKLLEREGVLNAYAKKRLEMLNTSNLGVQNG